MFATRKSRHKNEVSHRPKQLTPKPEYRRTGSLTPAASYFISVRQKKQEVTIKIEIVDTKAYIYTPYNAEFVKAIKGIGGARWNRDKSAWAIPADCADQAREIMRRVYGEDDRPDCGERVDVRLTFDSSVSEWQSAVTIYGKTISRAYGRDSGARCGDDVAFVEGQPESGGSVKNWTSVVPQGSIVVLHNVPATLLDQPLPKGVRAERLEERKSNRDALMAEKQRLLERIAEIDNLVAQMG